MKKSAKTLVFLTYQYPYLPGEYFVEEEIKYLAKKFDVVLVVPARILFWKPDEVPREMPTGVVLADFEATGVLSKACWYFSALVKTPVVYAKWKNRWAGRKSIAPVGVLHDLKSVFKLSVTAAALNSLISDRKIGNDSIAYSYWRNFSAAALGLLKAENRFGQLFVRCHRVDIYHPSRWVSQTIIHKYADGVFPVSDDGLNHLVNEKGLNSDIIQVQRLGVLLPEVLNQPSSDGVVRILSVSNIVPVKRVQLIAEVLGHLDLSISWTHIGDGSERDILEEQIEVEGLAKVTTLKGRLSNAEVHRFLRDEPVDCFVNLSESEGVPVSIMEALSYGIPVLATDVGGSGEIVSDSNGRVVHPDSSAKEIASTLSGFLREPDMTRYRKHARNTAIEICDAARNYQEFCDLIDK